MKIKALFVIFTLSSLFVYACVKADFSEDKPKDAWVPIDAKMLQVNCKEGNAPDICEDLPDFQRPNIDGQISGGQSNGGQSNGGQSNGGQSNGGQSNGGNGNCSNQLEQCHIIGDEDCDGKADCEDSDCDQMPCDDGNLCSHTDTCQMGICVGTEISCLGEACIDRSCNGTNTCTEISREGQSCEDGDPCTYGDICQGNVCSSPNFVLCLSDTCIDRTCNGTATCTESFKDGVGCDDGNACTHTDVCSAGACVGQGISCVDDACHFSYCNGTPSCGITPKEDGTRCGGANDRCCSGNCVNTSADERNCGGCGIKCNTGKTCYAANNNTTGYCSCGGNMDCIVGSNGNDFTCWDLGNGSPGRCNCQQDTDCAVGQTCHIVTGHNYCSY
jgi:hypothetical protein